MIIITGLMLLAVTAFTQQNHKSEATARRSGASKESGYVQKHYATPNRKAVQKPHVTHYRAPGHTNE